MWAEFTCEQCFQTYNSEDKFVQCHGDACNELICTECATACKDPTCTHHVCDNCKHNYSLYLGDVYCIKHAMFFDHPELGKFVNYDYIAKGQTHAEGMAYLKATKIQTLMENYDKEQEEKENADSTKS